MADSFDIFFGGDCGKRVPPGELRPSQGEELLSLIGTESGAG